MHESNHLAHRLELVLLDLKNPRSICSLMPDAFAKAVGALWMGPDAEMLSMSEPALLKELTRRYSYPAPIDWKLRAKFWIEFDRVMDITKGSPKMSMINILGRDFSKEAFYRHYITDHNKLAFLLCQPLDYITTVDMVLNMSTLKLLEILEAPTHHKGCPPEPTLVKKFLEINEKMHQRKLMLEYKIGKMPVVRGEKEEPEIEAEPEPVLETEEQKRAEIERLRAKINALPGIS